MEMTAIHPHMTACNMSVYSVSEDYRWTGLAKQEMRIFFTDSKALEYSYDRFEANLGSLSGVPFNIVV
jgi:hypothetical protein